MIEIAFALIALGIAILATKTDNFAWKNFLFLFFFFILLLIPVLHYYESEQNICVQETASYCFEWKKTYDIGGKDALIYGFGLLLIAILAAVLLSIVLKGFEGAV